MNLLKVLSILGLSFALGACGFQSQGPGAESLSEKAEAWGVLVNENSFQLRIIDEQDYPVVGAKVLVGFAPGNPFANNVLTTDDAGIADVSIQDWQNPLPVTVQSRLHLKNTYWRLDPGHHSLRLTLRDGEDLIEVSGQTTGFGNLRTDGNLHYGLVIPAFTRSDLLHFDIADVISPEVDVLRILGNRVEVPSNLTLPRQRENYVFPITFDKPQYRAFVRSPGVKRFVATHGNFPFRRVIDELRGGKSVFDVINHFNFISGGLRDIVVGPGGATQDLAVNQISFDGKVRVTAPQFARDEMMISLAMGTQDGYLFPTDVKRFESGESRDLKAPAASLSENFVLSAFKKMDNPSGREEDGQESQPVFPDCDPYIYSMCESSEPKISLADLFKDLSQKESFTQLSFALKSASHSEAVSFLPLIGAPEFPPNSPLSHLTLQVPQSPSHVLPVGTLIILSKIEMTGKGEMKFEKRTRLWQIMAGSWVDQVSLPDIGFQAQPGKAYRWEVLYLGQDARTQGQAEQKEGVYSVDVITHVTRNAVDF